MRPGAVIGKPSVERARELCGGRARRHQHERIGGRKGVEMVCEVGERRAIAGQVGRAQQPDATRGNHLPAGGSIMVSSSARAR